MTMSWVADENPSATAATAIAARPASVLGSLCAISAIAAATAICDVKSQARRCPRRSASQGSGRRSISGAQTNLKE